MPQKSDPFDPFDETARQRLAEVNQALRTLHRSLIDVVRRGYEADHGRIQSPGALLGLLMNDPFFAWLRPMSKIMVEMDELLDEETPLEPIRMAGLRERIEGMISNERYLATFQASPEVVMSHTALRQALGGLSQQA